MDIYFDLNSKAVTFGSVNGGAEREKVKIRQFEDLRVKFVRGGAAELLEVGASISVRLKLVKESAVTLTSCSSFTRPASTDGWYAGTMSLNTTQITADLFDATGATFGEKEVFFEMEWAPAAAPTQVRKSDDAKLNLVRSVVTGTESAATDASASIALRTLTELTALTGGTATCLDAVPSAGAAVGQIVMLVISDEPQLWQLRAGTDAPVTGAKVRGVDYDATANAKFWFRLL